MHRRSLAVALLSLWLIGADQAVLVKVEMLSPDGKAPLALPADITLQPSTLPTVTPVPTPTAVTSYVVGLSDTLDTIGNFFSLSRETLLSLNPGLEEGQAEVQPGDVIALAPGGRTKLIWPRLAPSLPPTPVPTVPALRMAELVYSTNGGTWWTFDDCERPYLPGTVAAIVKVLQTYGVKKVTFFMNGDCYQTRPDLVKVITSAGYEIGNHAYQHVKLSAIRNVSVETIADQIRRGPPGARVFRPPYWDVSPIVRLAATQAGYSEIIMATIDPGDSSESNLCPRILGGIGRPGLTSIVALHMTNRETPKALEAYFSGKPCS